MTNATLTATENAINLAWSPTGWAAEFTGPHEVAIQELFGCNTLPTAYGPDAPMNEVRAGVERLNPGCTVRVVRTSRNG